MKYAFILLAAALFLLMDGSQAWAWGPGVHLAAGNFFLSRLDCLAPEVARLLSCHPGAFLYGCLSADIFIGKGCTVRPGHSHNWSIGQGLLAGADSDRTKAYAYGYLSHLAADTVAHNHYVPGMMGALPSGGKLGHVYVEMLADRQVQWNNRQALKLFRSPKHEEDLVLRRTMAEPRLKFLMKKQVMKGHLSLCGAPEYRSSVDMAQRVFSMPGSRAYFREMFGLTLDAIGDFLTNPESSPVLQLDPIGSRALWRVKQLRRKRMRGLGMLNRPRKDSRGLFPISRHLRGLPDLYSACPHARHALRPCG